MKNVGGADRAIRILLAFALLSLFVVLSGYWKLFGLAALPLLVTGLTQKCAINKFIGRNSCSIR
ncbi:DUF2892 domain-containing protein [Paenibacillus sp. GCM10023248]|uniref:YgaP family membrane protein n=1 Tax=unclassified Paenibacillus TaxID=185978 RepID=UPI002379DBCE|nr:DUF2892 domain-containing protein [Paenibacillus sp. MAHUQ-63]MDD9270489.1 DUF2892 domain-containing protein [Paenibacillus sp. MAHUQ-63]